MNIIIINRWQDDFADYQGVVDHKLNDVVYITNNSGSKYLDSVVVPYEHYVVDKLEDINKLMEIVAKIVREKGKVDRLLALSEFDIRNAGVLRSKCNIPGMNEQTAKNFTDKISMKEALKNSSIRYPKYTKDPNDIITGKLKFPIVQKPREGAASEGVHIIDDLASFRKLLDRNPAGYDYEEFVSGNIYHVDGIKHDTELQFMKISRYINTCYEYEKFKTPLGSLLIKNSLLYEKIYKMTLKVLSTLGMETGVFHLEFILHDNEPVFLEVGARQGGGEIVPMLKQIYGVDLVLALIKSQMLEDISMLTGQENGNYGGFLLFPEPVRTPVKVKNKTIFGGKLKTLVYEITPSIGQVLDGNGGYYFNAGRFLFVGPSEGVKEDLDYVLKNYEVAYE